DDYGNSAQNIISPSNALTYFAPLIADQIVKKFTLNTTNTGRTDDNIRLVKQGDLVTVQFETTHAVTITKVLIGVQEVEVSTKDGKHWSGLYTVANLADNGNIPVEIMLNDGLGNPTFVITENHFEPVRYYAGIKIRDLSFGSNNINGVALAKNDDILILSFVTNHPTTIKKALIGGQMVTCTSSDGMQYTASYRISGQEKDQAVLSYDIMVMDNAGNDPVIQGNDQSVVYYAPLQVSALSMVSTNARDSSRYCKDGDSIVLFFKINHAGDVVAMINGKLQPLITAFLDLRLSPQ
ncbi:hypothetical protein, partial [Eubacterium aggregans]|uniref:hypothetical protein n=1 Tax=Eubacterium aggregans TaxID=81409 RepID=UPI003F2E0ABE